MADDDLLLDASDLADIFGAEDDGKAGEDFAKSIEDLFLSDEPEESAEDAEMRAFMAAPEASHPLVRSAPAAVVEPEPEIEPEVQEPDRGGMTEEQWRSSPEYAEFKRQVIARHLRKKALEENRQGQAAQAAGHQGRRRGRQESGRPGRRRRPRRGREAQTRPAG